MAWKEIVGTRFSPLEFDGYVAGLTFGAWLPQFVVVHNTGVPTLAQRPNGFTAAHMQNLVTFYRDTKGWSAGPHVFIDQNGIWVFTPLTTTGVHSPSWNEVSWGVEALGDYNTEPLTDSVKENLLSCLTTLHARLALDARELRLHKEDPNTTHTDCPGTNIDKATLIHEVSARLPPP